LIINESEMRMKKFLNKMYNRVVAWMNAPHMRRPMAAMLLLTAAVQMWAAGDGMSGINQATSMISGYFDPGTKLIYAIGAMVGLIGGVKVYGKFSSGDPDTSKTAASWFGACIFLIVAATILRSFFL
jgi:hypothetical protein